jgi:hypothetical protein
MDQIMEWDLRNNIYDWNNEEPETEDVQFDSKYMKLKEGKDKILYFN